MIPETPRHITLLGGGGHATVVAEAAHLAGFIPIGVYDDDPDCLATRYPCSLPSLGTLRDMPAGAHQGPSAPWILCLGDSATRRAILDQLTSHHFPPIAVIHPRAHVSPIASLAPGVFVGPLAVVHTCARIDPHAIINSAAVVEHHCHVGENAHVAPNATLGGNVTIGPDTLVGLGATVLPGVRIGAGCVVGAGAVVCHDLPDACCVVGSPARAIDSPVRA